MMQAKTRKRILEANPKAFQTLLEYNYKKLYPPFEGSRATIEAFKYYGKIGGYLRCLVDMELISEYEAELALTHYSTCKY